MRCDRMHLQREQRTSLLENNGSNMRQRTEEMLLVRDASSGPATHQGALVCLLVWFGRVNFRVIPETG